MPIPGLAWSDEQLFQLINCVLPAWFLLLAYPRAGIPLATLTAAALSVLYVATTAASLAASQGDENVFAQMTTFEGVAKLLATRSAVLPAWTHFGVFDLWTGRWEVVDALERGVPRILMALPLLFTMMLGPSGLLIYLALIRPWFKPKKGPAKRD